jgi:hypothetical protein
MSHFFTLANEIPIIMAIATVIIATMFTSLLAVVVRLIEPIPRVAIVAFLMALRGWAIVLQGLR